MSETKHVTSTMVMKGLMAAAEKRPGVYKRLDGHDYGCANTEVVDGKRVPSCIVGTFLVDTLGVDAEEVPSGTYGVTIMGLEKEGWTFEPKAVAFLGMAQAMQDTRKVEWQTVVHVLYEMGSLLDEFFSATLAEEQL